jgi:glycosyltransferase involved in cell wall biosynthesis
MKYNTFLSVIIFAYNEELNLESTVKIVSNKIKLLVKKYEILIVNDGSSDQTGVIAESLAKHNSNIEVIHHPQNFGGGHAIYTGIQNAKGTLITFFPADLAMDINQFYKYLDASENNDVIVGIRSDRRDYSFFRKLVSFINITLIRVLFGMKQRQYNYIHLYHSKIFNDFEIESRGIFITAEIMIKARDNGYSIAEVDIDYIPRQHGKASNGKLSVIFKTFAEIIKYWFKRIQ